MIDCERGSSRGSIVEGCSLWRDGLSEAGGGDGRDRVRITHSRERRILGGKMGRGEGGLLGICSFPTTGGLRMGRMNGAKLTITQNLMNGG